ncbi:MAG: ketoacyl-ACP synthase III [Firmicutes bacterium]|nr:ketoacyl-ACP synthase III [Bacillota bacterium]
MVKSNILSTAMYAPSYVLTNDEMSRIVDTSDEWITTRTGIKRRHISRGENTSDMAVKAGKKAIEKAGLSPLDIDAVILASMSADYNTPSSACIVQGALGCENAFAFDLSAACSGFVYALSCADKFIVSGAYKNILVIGAECLSKVLNWQDRGTCVIFGDGAGAAVLSAGSTGGIIAEDLHARGTDADKLTTLYSPVNNTLYKYEGEPKPYVEMDGRAIFNFAVKTVPKSIAEVVNKASLTFDDIKYIVPHQANARIIDAMAKKLKVSVDKFFVNIDEYGNTSAASIPMALAQMDEENMLQKGDKIIITGFGGGLTWGSMLIEI